MEPFPHTYLASASAVELGDVVLESHALRPLRSSAPVQFGGPGDRWSPETLLVAAIADCVILTFRALARSARLPYQSVHCEVKGTLDRVERVTAFTAFHVRTRLQLAAGGSSDEAHRLLTKAKEHCLITNSLRAPTTFEMDVVPAVESDVAEHALSRP